MSPVVSDRSLGNAQTRMTPAMDASEVVFETEWFNVERQSHDDIEALQGKPYYRINTPDGVIVLALTSGNKIVLVEQFRPVLGRRTLEVPAGAVDPHETPEAARELYEEAGYVCESMPGRQLWRCLQMQLTSGQLMASRLNARLFSFLGVGATRHPSYVPKEDIKVHLVSPAELKHLALSEQFGQYAALALLVLADWKAGASLTRPEVP